MELNRYSLITEKFPREFLLLQGTGCRWKKCCFCDYYHDVSEDPYKVNAPILRQVTGQSGVLDIINSGSCTELDPQTIALISEIIREKNIHTLWLEAHWMYRNQLEKFSLNFPETTVKYRVGAETFDPILREQWKKGIPAEIGPVQLARYFQGACLLFGLPGQSRESVSRDIELALTHFEYISLNLFNENGTELKRNKELTDWFLTEVYPNIKEHPKVEILLENTDLGVG